jgi:glycosyltransferase involved in cell wall biosynthesis
LVTELTGKMMKKIKVAHLFNEINFSGAEIMYAQAAPLLQEQGFELIAVSTGAGEGNYVQQYQQANYKIYHKPVVALSIRAIPQFIMYYVDFYRFLKKEHIEILHIHRSNLVFVALVAWLARVRCIKTQHNTFHNRGITLPYAIAWRFILRNFFNVTFQTIGESVYLNELNYYKNPSVRVNNWFDEKRFYPAHTNEEKIRLRNQFAIPHDAFVIISTGSCSHIKNHHDIIKALALVKDKIKCVYLHLGQGATEQEEKQLAVELGVSEMIRFLGNQDTVRDYLVAADLFIMTSKFEGLGNAALEAMACRLPCILYDVPGLRDLIKNDNNGFLIAPDHRLLADKMIDVQQNSSNALERANTAFSFASCEFSMPISVQKIMALYRS